MRVVLLSAGPKSLGFFNEDFPHDLRIGVNSAVSLYLCDWWCCGDAHRFEEIKEIGRPALFTMAPERDKIQQTDRLENRRIETWVDIGCKVNAPESWTTWSVISALVLAKWLGATSLDVFGHDMEGTTDCLGTEHCQRNTERWEKESAKWKEMVEWVNIPVRVHHNVHRSIYPDQAKLGAGAG